MDIIRWVWLDGADQTLPGPAYQTAGAAGADVCANLALADRQAGLLLQPGAIALIPTGFRLEIPGGLEVQIRPRSGLALHHGITLPNSPGTIDSDYRGPVGVIVLNLGANLFVVTHGMRIAQMVVAPVVRAQFNLVATLTDTDRAGGGFGSTGLGPAGVTA